MLTFVLSSVLYILVIRTSSGSPLTSRTRVECDPGMYYDPAIGRCDTCSVICDYADIQGTVDECNTKCPDYNTKLSTTQPDVKTSSTTDYSRSTPTASETTTITTSATTTVTTVVNSDTAIAICVLLALLILVVVLFALHHHRKTLVNLIKKRDCCGEDTPQVHAQETRQDSERPEMHELLPVGNIAFADMPDPR